MGARARVGEDPSLDASPVAISCSSPPMDYFGADIKGAWKVRINNLCGASCRLTIRPSIDLTRDTVLASQSLRGEVRGGPTIMHGDEDHGLQLLLAEANGAKPVLDEGLPEIVLGDAPPPERGPRGQDSLELDAPDRDPNDLPAQRWGVIAPAGEEGDLALAAIRPLIEHRRSQQGADPAVFRVRPDMNAEDSLSWKNEVLRAEQLPEDRRPRYLLILGDLDRVSIELQHILSHGSLVGRLHCPTLAGYRAYAEKVVEREREPAELPRALFYTVQDGTPAVQMGHRELMMPCLQMTREWSESGRIELSRVTEVPYSEWGPEDMFGEAGLEHPSVMLSLGHGLGTPRRGWRSPEHQRALQGALSMGEAEPLTADAVREQPFLPGGMWLCTACFSAGTPSTSAFHPWLSLLAEQEGGHVQASAVLRHLPRSGERPFIAALPQALLANPRGPLAIIGHMDLAWTFGFLDTRTKGSRASRMFSALRTLLAGSRVGVGLDALMHAYRETNDDLMARYQMQREAEARGQANPVAPRTLGHLWMLRNDLRGYVLLGDPAARLPVGAASRRPEDGSRTPDPAPALLTQAPTSTPPSTEASTTPSQPRALGGEGVTGPMPGPRAETVSSLPPGAPPTIEALVARPVGLPKRPRRSPEMARRESAVLALLRGDEAPKAVAARLGVPLEELFDLVELYRDAGCRAIEG